MMEKIMPHISQVVIHIGHKIVSALTQTPTNPLQGVVEQTDMHVIDGMLR
jgi:hypothetical protein